MNCREVLDIAGKHLCELDGQVMNVIDIAKPPDLEYATHLAKVISKLSPLIGNMIEYYVCQELNTLDWGGEGTWNRQDPGFPDTIFEGNIEPVPGIEIKTWFPLATEITARFKDSVNFFQHEQTDVALVAWVPEYIIYGKPKVIGVWIGSAKSLATARDNHYHKPPDYLVFEPEDTSARTSNLQQTNTNGYKFQGNSEELNEAEEYITCWGKQGKAYDPRPEYQLKIKELIGRFNYRLDTNFAKIDRIQHEGIENFKTSILQKTLHSHDLKTWAKLIGDEEQDIIKLIKSLI